MPDCVVYCCACGSRMDGEPALPASGAPLIYQSRVQAEGPCSFVVAAILCAFPLPGLARFYTGFAFVGLLQLLTGPIGLVWSFIDLVRILTNHYRDKEGRLLRGYSPRFAVIMALVVVGFIAFMANAIDKASTSASCDHASEYTVQPEQGKVSTQKPTGTKETVSETAVDDATPVDTAKADNVEVEGNQDEKEEKSASEASAISQNSVVKVDKTSEIEKVAKLEEEKKKAVQAKIADLHITKYPETAKELKKAGFPKMLKKYGVNGIKKINKLLPKVAEKAAQNPTMDKIAWVDVSDNKSTKNKMVFYAQANNSNRIYIAEDELNSDAPVHSDHEKLKALLHKHEEMCEQVIKNCLTHPSTYSKSLFDSASETQEYTNVIRIGFSARNSFNLEIEYEAIFRVNADSEIVYQSIVEKK